jgi:succinoglycan biosynthesis transport protein ExoP
MAASNISDSFLETILSIVRRRKWVGLIAFATVFSLAAPFSVFLPDIFRATATVIVESPEASSTFVKADVPELETRLVTIQQELLSRARLKTMITRLNLYPRWRPKVPLDAIADRVRRDIHVDFTGTEQARGRPTTIGLKITYIGLDPASAAAVPNALASLYVQENTKMRERQTATMAQFLKGQLDAAAQELDRHEARLNAYKKTHTGELPEQVPINLMALDRLNSQLRINSENQQKIRERTDRLSEITTKTAEGPDELTTYRQKLRELQTKYTDKHPEVIQTKAMIRELESQGLNESSGMASASHPSRMSKADRSSESELAMLRREEQSLQSEIATYDQKVKLAPRYEQELEEIENDYKTAKQSYDSIRGRYEEAQLADSLEQTKKGETFRVLDSAIVPTAPAAPNRLRLLLMATFLALVTAVGAGLVSEHIDTSFHTVGELRQFTSVPVLATIPYLTGQRKFASQALRVVLTVGAVICVCGFLAFVARHTARENTQLVWMLSGPSVSS